MKEEEKKCEFVKVKKHPKILRMQFKPLIPKKTDESPREENKETNPDASRPV